MTCSGLSDLYLTWNVIRWFISGPELRYRSWLNVNQAICSAAAPSLPRFGFLWHTDWAVWPWPVPLIVPVCSPLFVSTADRTSFHSFKSAEKYWHDFVFSPGVLSPKTSFILSLTIGSVCRPCRPLRLAPPPQTLHSWLSEELAGRSSSAALLSAEGDQEERCKQVPPVPNYFQHAPPNRQRRGRESSFSPASVL